MQIISSGLRCWNRVGGVTPIVAHTDRKNVITTWKDKEVWWIERNGATIRQSKKLDTILDLVLKKGSLACISHKDLNR
jgi:hypothetical protein